MAKLGISTGSQPNDGTGDTLLSGAEKVNANFTEVYTLCGDGTNLAPGIVTAIAAGDNISVSGASGQVTITALETTGISSYWNANTTGITTVARGVGIGTTTVTSKLTVVGGGNIGFSLAQLIENSETYIKTELIEANKERAEFLASHLENITVTCGDGLDNKILEEVNISDSGYCISITEDEERDKAGHFHSYYSS